ncbi:Nucleoside Diphosphate Kinase [Achlya hypogyna]|uniref:Nucleoside Diphosphate Kinase n=1 Tax=Achlya hypogyna TaxID=1202772 RepID=A0A1V9ZKC6_ACHHY|nr:Nucleoside Diphosphate Kinase [Achlya hypogyna]
MAPATSWTIALLKPDIASGYNVTVSPSGAVEAHPGTGKLVDDVLQRLKEEGFTVESKRLVQLTRMQVRELFRHCWDDPDFSDTLRFMTSGPCMALLLVREQAVEYWKALMGPDDPAAAKKVGGGKLPLRAMHGSSLVRNAFYGSATELCAVRDKEIVFPPTRRALEQSLVIFKPTALEYLDAISALFEKHGFVVMDQCDAVLDGDDDVAMLAAVSEDDVYTAELRGVLQQGRCRICLLEGVHLTAKLALLVGPADPAEATVHFPKSIRAAMGSSLANNVLHTLAATTALVARWFPTYAGLLPEKTYAMIKPGTPLEAVRAIQVTILQLGFEIQREARQTWSREDAMAFYAEHEGKPFFQTLIAYMSSGPIVAMMLSRVKAIHAWRKYMGPTNAHVARTTSPESLRARFGIDGTKNATHGSDSPQSALRELQLVFRTPILPCAPLKSHLLAQRLGRFQAESVTLHDALGKGLALLCQVDPRPTALDALEWLGQYLVRQALHRDDADDAAGDVKASAPTATAERPPPVDLKVPPLATTHIVSFHGPSARRSWLAQAMATQYQYQYMDVSAVLDKAAPGLDIVGALLKAFRRCTSKRVLLDNCPSELPFYLAFQAAVAEFAWIVYVSDDGEFSVGPDDADFYDFFQRFGQLHVALPDVGGFRLDVHDVFAPTLVLVVEAAPIVPTEQWRDVAAHFGWTVVDFDDVVAAQLRRPGLLRQSLSTGERLAFDELAALLAPVLTPPRCLIRHLPVHARCEAFVRQLLRRTGAVPQPVVLFVDPEPPGSPRALATAAEHFERRYAGLGLLYHQWVPGPTSVRALCAALAPLLGAQIGVVSGAEEAPWVAAAATARGYTVLDVKDSLRAEVLKRSAAGQTVQALVEANAPIPDDVVLEVLQRCLAQKQNRRALLSYFPQTNAQADALLKALPSVPAFVVQVHPAELVTAPVAPLATTTAVVSTTTPMDAAVDQTLCQWSVSMVLGDFDLAEVDMAALRARLPQFLVLHMNHLEQALSDYASTTSPVADDVVALLSVVLRRRIGRQLVLVGFPRSLAEAESFGRIGCAPDHVFVLHKKVLAVPHELTDEDYYSSDEEEKQRRKEAPEPEFDKLLRFYAGPALHHVTFVKPEMMYPPLVRALRPTVVLAAGHSSSCFVGPLRWAANATRRPRATHVHIPDLLDAFVQAFPTTSTEALGNPVFVMHVMRNTLCHSTAQVIVVSGYPRVIGATKPYVREQLGALETAIGPVTKLLHMQCSDKTLLERSGMDERLVQERTDEFEAEYAPLLEYCARDDTIAVETVDADKSPEALAAHVHSLLATSAQC